MFCQFYNWIKGSLFFRSNATEFISQGSLFSSVDFIAFRSFGLLSTSKTQCVATESAICSRVFLSLHTVFCPFTGLHFLDKTFLCLNFADHCSRRCWESSVPDWVSSLNDNSKLGNAKRLSINGHDNDVKNNKNRMMDVKLGMTLMMKLL